MVGKLSLKQLTVVRLHDPHPNFVREGGMDRREYMREYQKEWYKKNRDKEKARIEKYRKDLKEWFATEIVAKAKCTKCGEDHPATIDFHHRDPETKEGAIADLVANKRSKEAILKEIDKCDVLCSNCHRKLHYKERKCAPEML